MLNLHRSDTKPDWELVKPDQRNFWQMVASNTNGIITPANFVSITGALLVLIGLSQLEQGFIPLTALVLIGVGRLADILDGYIADKTATKGPLGEAIDAITDKVLGFLTIIVAAQYALLPGLVILVLVLHSVINTVIGFGSRVMGTTIHPVHEGKLAVALSWIVFTMWFINVIYARNHNHDSSLIKIVAILVTLAFTYFATATAIIYFKQFRKVLKND